MAAAAAAAAAAAQSGFMRPADFERLVGRPASTSSAITGRSIISYIAPQARLGGRTSTTYTGASPVGGESLKDPDGSSTINVDSWTNVSKNGKDFNWDALGAYGMGMQGFRYVTGENIGRRMVTSACGVTPAYVNAWQRPGAMNWTMFPVVYKVPGAFAVVPFLCMISQVAMEHGPPQSGLQEGRKPQWQVLPTLISERIVFFVDVSHVNMDNWDAQMSIVAALNVYFPRNAADGNYYLMLQPFGVPAQVLQWQRQAGIQKAIDQEYIHLQSHGASLGLAVAACCVGLPSLMYTGYTSNIARRMTLPSRKANFNSAGDLIGAIETSGTSDWVETVQDVDFKIGWAFANGYPIVIPMVDALTSLNMSKVVENLTKAYSVYYPPPKGSGVQRPTITAQVWGTDSSGLAVGSAQTLGQYAMFANNRDLTLYTASDVFSAGKYMNEGGVVLAAGSLSEALIVSFAAATAYAGQPNFQALNQVQASIAPAIQQQLRDKVDVLQEVDVRKKAAAKAKREANKAAGIKPKKSTPKPKRAAPTPARLATVRKDKTDVAKTATAARKATRQATQAMRATPSQSAAPAMSRAVTSVDADASAVPSASALLGSQTAIRNAPGASKDLAYAQMLSSFLAQHEKTPAAANAQSYYEVMGTRHDSDRITPFQRTGVVRTRPGREFATVATEDDSSIPLGQRGRENTGMTMVVPNLARVNNPRAPTYRQESLQRVYEEAADDADARLAAERDERMRLEDEMEAERRRQRGADEEDAAATMGGMSGRRRVAGNASSKFVGRASGGKFTNAQYLRAQGVNPR